MPTYRTLRCANAQLYIAASVMVLAAAVYVLCCKDALWQQMAAILALIITPVWAAHYALLRYTITEESITRRSLLGSTTMRWADLTSTEIQETHQQATESCTIILQTGSTRMSISSELLPLDDVQELAKELRASGLSH